MKNLFICLLLCITSLAQVSQVAHGGTGRNTAGLNYVLIGTGTYTYTLALLPNCPDTGGNHWNYNNSTQTVTCGTSGTTITCSVMPALTGDVTSSAGSCVTTNVNLPDGVTQAGRIVGTNIAAPSTPASGHVSDWFDSTDLRFHDKNSAGVIGTTVVAHTAATHKFFNSISAAGATGEVQPDYSDLTGTPGCGTLTGDVTSTGCATSVVKVNGASVPASTQALGSNGSSQLVATYTLASGTSVSLTAPFEIYVCTGTCTVTPPVPALGYQFCMVNGDNVSTVITLAALGSSARYENTARTAYGTAGTGTFVSGGAVKDFVCIVGLDSTHYITTNFNGTWTAN